MEQAHVKQVKEKGGEFGREKNGFAPLTKSGHD